jgi:hypothetical protein
MSPKAKILCIVGALAAIVVFAGYQAMQPKLRLATREEVMRQIDPKLLELLPHDVAAEGRYREAQIALKAKDWGKIDEIRKAGPILAPPIEPGRPFDPADNFPNFDGARVRLKQISASAISESSSDPAGAVATLADGYRFARWLEGGDQNLIEYLVHLAMIGILNATVLVLVESGHLNETQLNSLFAIVGDASPSSAYFGCCLVGEFQGSVLPVLPGLNAFKGSRPEYGTYDAIETAKWANDLFLHGLKLTDKPYPAGEDPIEKSLDLARAELPEEPSDTMPSGIGRSWFMFVFRFQANNFHNYWGTQLVGASPHEWQDFFASELTSIQLLQAAIRIKAFKMRQGRLPKDWSELGFAPNDYFADSPLKYSASKKVLYSVGSNLTDDGGDVRLRLTLASPDYGFAIAGY